MSSPVAELAIDVEIDGVAVPAGVATFTGRAGKIITEFRYVRDFVSDGYDLEPGLPRQSVSTLVEGLPGAFSDSAPDWWGRNLISRRVRAQARGQGTSAPVVTDVDFLTGVSDTTRQGALRFRPKDGITYVADDVDVPMLVALPDLLAASDQVVTDPDDVHAQEAIKALLAAGSGTLGGARPKASVRSGSRLYIAKFPHPVADQWDVMAWEKTVLDLAEQAGINVPGRRLQRIGGRSVLLIERFDRVEGPDDSEHRVGYVSASTLLGGSRSQTYDYLDVQAAVEDHSAAVDADLVDLWRRIAFSVAVHNTDDHLRNHGFLRTAAGWRLSPLFDVNPNPELAQPRATSINGEAMRAQEVAALREIAQYFGLSDEQSRQEFDHIVASNRNWREVAAGNGVGTSEIDRFAPVFDIAG